MYRVQVKLMQRLFCLICGDIRRFNALTIYAVMGTSIQKIVAIPNEPKVLTNEARLSRAALVESSWSGARKDPALLMKYKEYSKRMKRIKLLYA